MIIEDEIILIEEYGMHDVIDITVDDDDHYFFANDILTHNSAVNKEDAGMENVADSMGINHTADLIIGLTQPEEFKEENKVKFEVYKSRISKTGDRGFFKIDYDKLKIVNEDISVDTKVIDVIAKKNGNKKNHTNGTNGIK